MRILGENPILKQSQEKRQRPDDFNRSPEINYPSLQQPPEKLQKVDDPQPPRDITNRIPVDELEINGVHPVPHLKPQLKYQFPAKYLEEHQHRFDEIERKRGSDYCVVCRGSADHVFYKCPNVQKNHGFFCCICDGQCRADDLGEHASELVYMRRFCGKCWTGSHWTEQHKAYIEAREKAREKARQEARSKYEYSSDSDGF